MKPSTFTFDTRIGDRDLPLRIRRMEPQNTTELHEHEFSELAVVYGGSGEHYDGEGGLSILARGDVFIVGRGQSHRYGAIDGLLLVNVLFEASSLPMPFLDASAMPGFHLLFHAIRGATRSEASKGIELFKLQEEALEELLGEIAGLERELAGRLPGRQFAAVSRFMRICAIFSRSLSGSRLFAKRAGQGVAAAMDYLHKRFDGPVDIAKLASSCNMSMSTLLRSFKRANGCAPKEYLMRLRVNCASELLLTTDLDVGEVGLRSGFDDANYFSREFKRATGLPPRRYRGLFRGS